MNPISAAMRIESLVIEAPLAPPRPNIRFTTMGMKIGSTKETTIHKNAATIAPPMPTRELFR
jgi:hypothetical protein